jgi:uncharacterized membrane protein (DUF485 family)
LLFALMLLIFFTYTLLLMFAPSVFAIPVWPGAATKLGIPFGMAVVIVSFALTGVYVYRANREFDEITKEILEEAGKLSDVQN